MDSGVDFIKPEFLNILFFQQKNLVIFPYVDLKHLHALELFAEGYNIVDLESTVLNNLKEILEYDNNSNYSQKPTLYFIYNTDKKKILELIELKGIHCIINTNENVSDLADGVDFIFYNKKNNQFLNYNLNNNELVFESELITSSENEVILQDKIQRIKTTATKIFTELNQSGNLDNLSEILAEYEKEYWDKILTYTGKYYHIEIPEVKSLKFVSKSRPKKQLKDFSHEYEIIISQSKVLAKEFIQQLHEYRGRKVNPANLELEELYNPQKLYTYLRNHHWKEGIPDEYISEWIQMKFSQYELTNPDILDFQIIFEKLGIAFNFNLISSIENSQPYEDKKQISLEPMPSIKRDLKGFTTSLFNTIGFLEDICRGDIDSTSKSIILEELSDIIKLIRERNSNENEVSEELHKEEARNGRNNFLVIDITNILNLDKNENKNLKVENIRKVTNAVVSLGYNPIMVADASMKYHLDDQGAYDDLIENNIIIQSPAGVKADEYILEIARREQYKFLANDKYEEYWAEFGKDWIFQNRLTSIFVNGKFIIRDKKDKSL